MHPVSACVPSRARGGPRDQPVLHVHPDHHQRQLLLQGLLHRVSPASCWGGGGGWLLKYPRTYLPIYIH